MEPLSPRTRLMRALRGEPTDRTPIWLLFPYHPLGCYADVRSTPCYAPIVEMAESCAITLNRRSLGAPTFTAEVRQWQETEDRGDCRISRTLLEYKGRRLVAETRRAPRETRVQKLIRTDADLEFFCSLPLNTSPRAIRECMAGQRARYMTEKREFPPELGSMMLALGEPISAIQQSCDLVQFSIWSLTHTALIEDFIERNQQRYREIYRYCLDADLADVYFLVGSELAAPPMVSRDTFQRWIVPPAKELIGMIHERSKFAIQHFHGQIRDILPDFVDMAPDALHTIESPPIGNCTMTQAYDAVGEAMALIGNIQYDEFRALSSAGMAEAVRTLLDECRGRRLIISPTAGPYEATLTPKMVQNYLTFMQTAWEYGVHA